MKNNVNDLIEDNGYYWDDENSKWIKYDYKCPDTSIPIDNDIKRILRYKIGWLKVEKLILIA